MMSRQWFTAQKTRISLNWSCFVTRNDPKPILAMVSLFFPTCSACNKNMHFCMVEEGHAEMFFFCLTLMKVEKQWKRTGAEKKKLKMTCSTCCTLRTKMLHYIINYSTFIMSIIGAVVFPQCKPFAFAQVMFWNVWWVKHYFFNSI